MRRPGRTTLETDGQKFKRINCPVYLSSASNVGRTGFCRKRARVLQRAEVRPYNWYTRNHVSSYIHTGSNPAGSFMPCVHVLLPFRELIPLQNPNTIPSTRSRNTARTKMSSVLHRASPAPLEPRTAKQSKGKLHDQELDLNRTARGETSSDTKSEGQGIDEQAALVHIASWRIVVEGVGEWWRASRRSGIDVHSMRTVVTGDS